MPRLNRRSFEVGAALVALAVLGVMASRLASADGLLLANGQPLFGDFISFWSAGRLVLQGDATLVHDQAAIMSQHVAAIPDLGVLAPWNYPPTFLLIAMALATMPYSVAALVFLSASAASYLVAARKLLPDARALVFAITAPAALFHLGSVQTGLMVAALTALALVWLDKRPLCAGALIGLLAIKPHMAVLWPLLLALTGRWRAFAAAMISAMLFVIAAGAAFGWESYVRFFANLSAAQNLIGEQRVATETFASLYGNLIGLGAPHTLAMIAHVLSAVAAMSAAIWIFRRSDARAQGAALCAATMLISPYLFFYDTLLLAAGAALLAPPRDRFEIIALIAAWGAGLSLALGTLVATLPLCPLAAWLVLLAAARRARGAAYPTKTAPAPPRSAQSSPREAA